MATLVKKHNKYYIRIRLPGGREKTISTHTGNRREAERKLALIEDKEILFKAQLIKEAELEDLELQVAKDRFIRDRRLNGRRPTTINSYELSMDNLIEVTSPRMLVRSLTKKHIQKMVNMLHDKKIGDTTNTLKDATINIRIRSVNAFTNWLYQEGHILEPIKIPTIKLDEPLPKFLTPEELDNLYAKVNNPKMLSTLKVYEGTGMRLSELHHSHRKDNYIIVPAEYSKSRRDRLIPISDELIQHYEIAMDHPYKPHSITHAFRKYADKAKLPPDKTLHSMRHTFALRTFQQPGVKIVHVKELLGHSSINTTMIYLKFPEEYIAEIFKIEPKSKTDPSSGEMPQA